MICNKRTLLDDFLRGRDLYRDLLAATCNGFMLSVSSEGTSHLFALQDKDGILRTYSEPNPDGCNSHFMLKLPR